MAPDGGADDAPGVIGPCTLLDVLGEGGMGVVYRVRQSEPVAREAALEILKPARALRWRDELGMGPPEDNVSGG